jgi:hypothetical protein
MAQVHNNFLRLFFFVSFSVIIPTLQANRTAESDDYWMHRADEAQKANLLAFHSHPEEVTNDFNSHVNK